MRRRGDDGRALATVLFTDIVGSTELAAELGDVHWKQVLATHHGVVRQTLKRYRGKEIDTAGDGFFATFARPADAIRCASDIIDQLRAIGIHIRAGVHMGEVEQMGSKVGGIAVHIGARVASKAAADEILVSSTVRDLVSGSDIRFGARGAYDLKGVPGQWSLLAVERELKGDAPDRPLIEAPAAKAARRRTVPTLAIVLGATVIVALAAVGVAAIVLGRGGGLSKVATPGPNTLSLVNIRSSRFDGTVEVGNQPADAVSGSGSIWVLNTADSTFSQVDSATGKVVSTPRSVGGTPTGIAFGAGSVWISTEFGGVGGEPGSVLRFDIAGGAARKVIPVGNGVASIAFGDGALWVTNTISNTLSRIDPDTDAVVQTWHVGNSPQAVVVGGGEAWVANTLDNSVWRIDESSGKVVARITVLQPPSGLTLDGTTLWVVSETGNTVSTIDTTTGTPQATIPVGAEPLSLVAGAGGVWLVTDQGHDVERIDSNKGSVVARLRVNGSPEGIAMDGARVWVSVSK